MKKKITVKKKKQDKWGKKQVFIINVDPYRQACLVVLNGKLEDAIKHYRKLNNPRSLENIKYIEKEQIKEDSVFNKEYKHNSGSALLYVAMPHGYLMFISHQDSWIETTNLISHECLHLVFAVLGNAGIEHCSDSEESYTYLHGELLSSILKKLY